MALNQYDCMPMLLYMPTSTKKYHIAPESNKLPARTRCSAKFSLSWRKLMKPLMAKKGMYADMFARQQEQEKKSG